MSENSPERALGGGVVAAVDAAAAARDAPDEDDPPPLLGPHAGEAGLGDDELAARVDLHHLVPVVLANVGRVADAAPEPGVGDEDRDGRVPARDVVMREDARDQVARRLPGREVGLEGEEELRGVLGPQLLS